MNNNMDVIVSRFIGIKGTAILARFKYDELVTRYPKWLVDEATRFDEEIDDKIAKEILLPELRLALDDGAVYAKEYTEFGIFEALFSMSKELKCGLRINIKDIPIKQETVEVCEFVHANPYALYSGYSSVIVAKNGLDLVKKLEDYGISATIVGYTTNDNDKLLINAEEKSFIQHIRKDELKNILGRREYYERTDIVNLRKE